MLNNIYARTDMCSVDQAPDVSVDEKLQVIAASDVVIEPAEGASGKIYENIFHVTLPYISGAQFQFDFEEVPEMLYCGVINVGDAALYKRGIGTRIIKAACRHAVEQDERIRVLKTSVARLGLLNTAINIFGKENVATEYFGRYGCNGEKPLEAIFDDYPPEPDERYIVGNIWAAIDRDTALSWEAPEYQI